MCRVAESGLNYFLYEWNSRSGAFGTFVGTKVRKKIKIKQLYSRITAYAVYLLVQDKHLTMYSMNFT